MRDVAAYLRVPVHTVYANWRAWRLPFRRIGRHLRISRAALDAWYGTQPTR